MADRLVDLDELVLGTAPPVLVLRQPVEEPAAVFRSILHTLTGNFQQAQNFSHSFTLVTDDGALLLLHVVSEQEVHEVRKSLQVSPDISAQEGEELISAMAGHGERYLKAGCACESRRVLRRKLPAGDRGDRTDCQKAFWRVSHTGCWFVGKHAEGQSRVGSEDYQLMHMVRDIPVLAL